MCHSNQLKPDHGRSREIFSLLLSIYDAKSMGSIYLHIKASLAANRSKSIYLKKCINHVYSFIARRNERESSNIFSFLWLSHAGTFNESIDAEPGFEPGSESRHPDALYTYTTPTPNTDLMDIFSP